MRFIQLIIHVVFLLSLATPLKAQSNKDVVGKWRFESLRRVGEEEPASRASMEFVLGKNSYKQLFWNNTYAAYDNERISYGRWKFKEGKRKIIMTGFNGGIRSYEIEKLANDTLVLLSHSKVYATLVRDKEASETPAQEPALNIIPVKATAKQISKRWLLTETKQLTEPTKEEQLSSIIRSALKGSWYDFKSDGVALLRFNSLKKATWHFDNKNKSIVVMESNGDGTLWHIISVSDSQLILQRPHASAQLIFSEAPPIPYKGKKDPLLLALDEPDENLVYSLTDILPQFPGGSEKIEQWVQVHRQALSGNGLASGSVNISAIVDVTGEILKPKVVHSLSRQQDAEALRLVKAMPLWQPAYKDNKLVKASVIIHIPFDD